MTKIIDIVMYILAGAIVVSLATSIELKKMHYESLVDELEGSVEYEQATTLTNEVVELKTEEDEAVKKKRRIVPRFMRKGSK